MIFQIVMDLKDGEYTATVYRLIKVTNIFLVKLLYALTYHTTHSPHILHIHTLTDQYSVGKMVV